MAALRRPAIRQGGRRARLQGGSGGGHVGGQGRGGPASQPAAAAGVPAWPAPATFPLQRGAIQAHRGQQGRAVRRDSIDLACQRPARPGRICSWFLPGSGQRCQDHGAGLGPGGRGGPLLQPRALAATRRFAARRRMVRQRRPFLLLGLWRGAAGGLLLLRAAMRGLLAVLRWRGSVSGRAGHAFRHVLALGRLICSRAGAPTHAMYTGRKGSRGGVRGSRRRRMSRFASGSGPVCGAWVLQGA